MAYRGKIVSLEKREAETRKRLQNLQQKVASVMAELNMVDDNPLQDALSDTAIDSNSSLPASGASSQFDTNHKSKHTSWAKTIQAEPSPSMKSSSVPPRPPVPIIKKLDYPTTPVAVDVAMDTEMNTYLNARLTDLTGTGNLSGRGSDEDFFPKTSPPDGLQRELTKAFDVGSDSNLNRTICKSRDFEMGSDADYGLDILKGSDVDKGAKFYKNFHADVGSDSQEGRVIISRNNSYDSNVDTYDRFGSGVDSSENNTRILTSSAPARSRGIGVGGALTVVGTAFSITGESVVEESDPLLDSEC
ncbi:unnamed protein product [Lymnaea stagnalis]|uniref:Uncharacterized protein n=1 Tax=Lymnaea stagnalis TaxID=6523 RepID=A0AAV2IBZ1_LYMST